MSTVADFLMAELARRGVSEVFVLPGGGAMHLVDALARNSDLEPVPMLHEQAVGIAAEAYSQYRNGLGVALVTSGPGATNALTATAAAWLDSTPCIFISGQVKRADLAGNRGVRQFGFQEIDIVGMVSGITKAAVRLDDPTAAPAQITEVLDLATTGRPGPVWIDVPLDVQSADVQSQDWHIGAKPQRQRNTAPPEAIQQVAEWLGSARRPLILLGNGVRLAKAESRVRDFLKNFDIPVSTTWKALDLINDDDPLFAGRPGSIAARYANFSLQAADFVLALGARLDLGQVAYRYDTFAPHATIAAVDIDQAELEKLDFGPRYLPIHADAGSFIDQLTVEFGERTKPNTEAWLDQIRYWRSIYGNPKEDDASWSDGVSQYRIVDAVSRLLPSDGLLVPGSSGASSEAVMQTYGKSGEQRVLNTEGLGPMGFGLPAAIGACIASGGKTTLCIDGDGGFAMNMQELSTLGHRQLPIAVFVLDNGGYGSIRATSRNFFDGRMVGCDESSGLALPDYCEVAPAFGVLASRVTKCEQVDGAVERALQLGKPSVTVFKIGSQSSTHPRVKTVRSPDGHMITSPLHELFPKIPGLDFEQVIKNM